MRDEKFASIRPWAYNANASHTERSRNMTKLELLTLLYSIDMVLRKGTKEDVQEVITRLIKLAEGTKEKPEKSD